MNVGRDLAYKTSLTIQASWTGSFSKLRQSKYEAANNGYVDGIQSTVTTKCCPKEFSPCSKPYGGL